MTAKDISGLAQRIRSVRQVRGMSQAALAERAGTTQPVIARIEAGRVTPSLGTLERVADALGVELIVQLNPPSLEKLRASVAEEHESLLHALDRVAPEWFARAHGHPDSDRYIRPYVQELLELGFEAHPWARLLVASVAHQFPQCKQQALAMVEESWRDFQRARNRKGQSYVAWTRGIWALGSGDLQEARVWWERARELLPKDSPLEPIDELALANSALGSYARADLDECAATARQAVVLAQLRANRPAEGLGLVYLAFVALNRGDFPEAEDLLGRADVALEGLAGPGEPSPRSLVGTCLGTLLVLRGQEDEALKAFAQAEELSDLWFLVIARAVRAELTAPFDADGAEEAARFVLEWSRTSGDLWWRTWAERGLGIVARIRGFLEASRQILTAVRDLNPLERGRTLIALGETLAELNDQAASIEVLRKAASLFEERGATYWEVRALVLLARIQQTDGSSMLARARAKSTADPAYALLVSPTAGRLAIRLQDPRWLTIDGAHLRFRSRRAAELIYRLAAEGPMDSTDVASELWPTCEAPAAVSRLRTAVWDARRGLGPEAWRLERKDGLLHLQLAGAEVEK